MYIKEDSTEWFFRRLLELDDVQYVEVKALDSAQYLSYQAMRLKGESHNMAMILATGAFPATRTDREFNAGRCNGNQFEGCPARGNWLRSLAEEAGVSTVGKTYIGGLADWWGDPTAWVSSRGDVLRVAEAKNLTVRGQVEYQGHEVEPMPDVAVDPGLIDDEVEYECGVDPTLDPVAFREDLVRRRSGAVDNHPIRLSPDRPEDEFPLPG